jgi:hypothetical protein
MSKKKKVLNWWGTKMRNPRSIIPLEYVGVSAPSIKALERFYNALFPDSIRPFKRDNCHKVRITKQA